MIEFVAEVVDQALGSAIIVALSILYFFIRAVTTYDSRVIQAKMDRMGSGVAARSYGFKLPSWVGHIAIMHYVLAIVLLLLNWKFFIILYVAIFVLRVIPVMENIGYLIMRPFLIIDRTMED